VLQLIGCSQSNADTLSVAKTTVKTHGARILTKLNLRDAGVLTYEGTVALR
jgi:DNA-binding NarL/FixJ family response regulator